MDVPAGYMAIRSRRPPRRAVRGGRAVLIERSRIRCRLEAGNSQVGTGLGEGAVHGFGDFLGRLLAYEKL